jgi:hypothetical protein
LCPFCAHRRLGDFPRGRKSPARRCAITREFSVRVSLELAGWVRRQGSPQEVIELLAVRTVQGQLRVGSSDPGPGPERLTVRFPESGLSRLRAVTHSRENLTAFRKLILAGYQSQALPPAHRIPPEPRPKVPTIVLGNQGGTNYALPPALFAQSPSLAESLSQAGIYWPGEIGQGETLARKKKEARAQRFLAYLLYTLIILVILALKSERREASKPSARSQRPAGPQDRPWFPEMDSHLSKVVWGYD